MLITSVSTEKLFPRLIFNKNYLRSTMSQTRLTGHSKIFIEKDIAETINYNSIINDFASKKAKKNLFKIYIIVYIYFIYLN